jgi:hypothetical protein
MPVPFFAAARGTPAEVVELLLLLPPKPQNEAPLPCSAATTQAPTAGAWGRSVAAVADAAARGTTPERDTAPSRLERADSIAISRKGSSPSTRRASVGRGSKKMMHRRILLVALLVLALAAACAAESKPGKKGMGKENILSKKRMGIQRYIEEK